MGEVLYIPSYWFHYIVSQDASIQCNARSGKGRDGLEAIEECGFANGAKKKMMKEQMKGGRSGKSGRKKGKRGKGGMEERGEEGEEGESGENGSGSGSRESSHLRSGKKNKRKNRQGRSVGAHLAPEGDQWTFEN